MAREKDTRARLMNQVVLESIAGLVGTNLPLQLQVDWISLKFIQLSGNETRETNGTRWRWFLQIISITYALGPYFAESKKNRLTNYFKYGRFVSNSRAIRWKTAKPLQLIASKSIS